MWLLHNKHLSFFMMHKLLYASYAIYDGTLFTICNKDYSLSAWFITSSTLAAHIQLQAPTFQFLPGQCH
jgi:hypothetical protein